MKTRNMIALLVVFLVSCAPALTPVQTVTPPPTSMQASATSTAILVPLTPVPEINLVTETPSPPEPLFIPVITPNALQVASWKQYQAALAKSLLREMPPEMILCEWDILGQTDQEVYVWALCRAPDAGAIDPAVIHLNADGSINNVKTPQHGSTMEANIQKIFPVEIQKKISYYLSPLFSERIHALEIHLQYRLTHSDESPLIMLTVTPMP